MKKRSYLILAVVLWLFYTYGLFRWLQSGHGFADVWQAATADWLLLLTLIDAGVFALVCLAWMWRDTRRQGLPAGKRIAYLSAALVVGAAAFFFYLAHRRTQPPQ